MLMLLSRNVAESFCQRKAVHTVAVGFQIGDGIQRGADLLQRGAYIAHRQRQQADGIAGVVDLVAVLLYLLVAEDHLDQLSALGLVQKQQAILNGAVPAGGMYDWNLSSEYIAYGPSMADKEGVLKQVGYETANGVSTITYEAMMPGTCTVTLTDRSFAKIAEATVTVTDGSAAPDTPSVNTPSTDNKAAETPAAAGAPSAAAAVSTAPVDTRTAQQREIDEAKANGTWGIEYTTCQKCGYHNWTRKGNVYVCDTCGNETTTVVSAKGVKGYVGSGAIAPVANKAAAPETRYANAKQAQAAADAREAAYAAAVAAFQKQIAANEAAYLAAIAK